MKKRSRIPRSVRLRAFGARCVGMGMSGVVKTTKGGMARYRSRLELEYIRLMEQSRDIKSFRMEPFAVPYEVRAGSKVYHKKYTPDAFVEYHDGRREIWEMKLLKQCKWELNVQKWAALAKHLEGSDVKFRVMTELPFKNGKAEI